MREGSGCGVSDYKIHSRHRQCESGQQAEAGRKEGGVPAADSTGSKLWENEQPRKPSGGIREGGGREHLAIVPALKQDERPCKLDNGAPCNHFSMRKSFRNILQTRPRISRLLLPFFIRHQERVACWESAQDIVRSAECIVYGA
jgi:hypothetical protein